jgi:hypothetical protein
MVGPELLGILEVMDVAHAGTIAMCLATVSCAASRYEWEPAGSGASFLPRDQSIEQVFKSDDEAAKTACMWLWKNEPKAQQFEYCGHILRDPGGFRVTVPMTMREPARCPRPLPGPETATGWYHSHRRSVEFSGPDQSHGFTIANYLCAPDRSVRKLTPEGTVIVR